MLVAYEVMPLSPRNTVYWLALFRNPFTLQNAPDGVKSIWTNCSRTRPETPRMALNANHQMKTWPIQTRPWCRPSLSSHIYLTYRVDTAFKFHSKRNSRLKQHEAHRPFHRLDVHLRLLAWLHKCGSYPQSQNHDSHQSGDWWQHLLHQRRPSKLDESHPGIFPCHHHRRNGDSIFCVFHATDCDWRNWLDHCQR